MHMVCIKHDNIYVVIIDSSDPINYANILNSSHQYVYLLLMYTSSVSEDFLYLHCIVTPLTIGGVNHNTTKIATF